MAASSFPDQFAIALERRRELLERFSAVRLVDGTGDGLPDIYIDKFGPLALVHVHTDNDIGSFRGELASLPLWESIGISQVYLRQRFRKSSRSAEVSADLVRGEGKSQFILEEHGVSYLIDPIRHLNAGFFIDTRDLRLRLKTCCAGRRVLNLFCYTGSLGLSALAGGAREVVQVDISKGILSWARENLELNPRLPGTMRVIPEDSQAFMQREIRRVSQGGELYDVIVVDPPSFSRSARGTFQVERDLDGLVESALCLLGPGGDLIVTTNCSSLSADEVGLRMRAIAGHNHIRLSSSQLIQPPLDFPSRGEDSIACRGALVTRRADSGGDAA